MSLTADKKYILLDTCIIEYWLDPYLASVISAQLSHWTGEEIQMAISDVTFAELINGANKEKVEKIKNLLYTLTQAEVSQRILIGSSYVSNVYKKSLKKTNGAGFQDKVIAATSFAFNLPIITADVNDFPHPFFTSFATETLEYTRKDKRHKHYLTIDILKPNIKQFNYWFSQVP